VDVSQLPVEPAREGSALSGRLVGVLSALRAGRGTHPPCFAVRQGTPLEAVAMPLFVEDRTQGQMAYIDFLQTLHKQVATK
jgi:hypothetical protein